MKLVAQVKLLPNEAQRKALQETMVKVNQSANRVSEDAFASKVFQRFDLHHRWYSKLREETGLTAQVVALIFGKVSDAYKVSKDTQVKFRELGAITYDSRVISYKLEKQVVSIWTVNGREKISFACGDYQTELLKGQRGETDLCLVDGEFYLMAVCDTEDPPLREVNGFLGVDLGIVQIASDSEGNQYSGEAIRSLRRRMRKLRAGLQKCGTKSAKRHLVKVRRKQSRFTKWVNHNISRRIVETAVASQKALALETLTGIRERGNGFNREMRFELGNWAFYQLGQFICYKAKQKGIPVAFVEARNTSRTCSCCGYCAKHNRKSQSKFQCQECGFEGNADLNASINISNKARGNVTCPIVGTCLTVNP